MKSEPLRITIIEGRSSWLSTLSQGLIDQEYQVTHVESPDALDTTNLVILGIDKGSDPAQLVARVRERVNTAKIILIVPAKYDREPKELRESTGVAAVIVRGDDHWRTIGVVDAVGFEKRRLVKRFHIRTRFHGRIGKTKMRGSLRDIANNGALVTVAMRLQKTIKSGDELLMSFESPSDLKTLQVKAAVRRSFVRSTFWGKRLALGIQFIDVDDDLRKRIDEVIAYLQEDDEIPPPASFDSPDIMGV